jgi:alkylhydroperoxidase/carboxymuconolactone decarboxylase family protein YurZ
VDGIGLGVPCQRHRRPLRGRGRRLVASFIAQVRPQRTKRIGEHHEAHRNDTRIAVPARVIHGASGPYKNALALNEAAEADRAKRVGDLFGAAFPGVTQYTTDVLFRDLWLRPGLAPRDRSLVTISSLVASGQAAQLTGHVNIGMNNGLTQIEIAEALTHLAFYAGWPNVFSAMPIAKDVFEKRPR